eukprot:CAMPEP_0204510776 /NCGR_PEP_ID=MMETSP0661-20131031/76_1 /ASSEMBLY_ACC=CAM_ASM_000606 /TAXON_ID=109239 /ORGANISM="Alexandrium margalefi, Strain AMGDE01CS-322" /LENGTH=364 /DNA_ID=CAMNT_0051515825 /DNA_START=65 /DNA_END=1159 /DNA_ORIENTATION=+
MSPTRMARAFNAFYRQHQFPKPDPTSEENSMAGLDPAAAGLGLVDIVFCQLSPLHELTLDTETKAAANIPQESAYFAWAYPAVLDPAFQSTTAAGPEKAFLEYGGYVYFSTARDAVGANAIAPAPLGTLGLMFGRPQPLPEGPVESMTKHGRFQEITLAPLAAKGATHFSWIRPGEFQDAAACPDGAFAYKFQDGTTRYYPVVQKPVYTPELVAEELEEGEAWVVVRLPDAPPAIEQVVIFDRSRTLEANMAETAAQSGVVMHTNAAELQATLRRDADGGRDVGYSEWAAAGSPEASGRGTLAHPWIATVRPAGASLPEANQKVDEEDSRRRKKELKEVAEEAKLLLWRGESEAALALLQAAYQ